MGPHAQRVDRPRASAATLIVRGRAVRLRRFRGTAKREVSLRGSAEPRTIATRGAAGACRCGSAEPRSELCHATVPRNREQSRHGVAGACPMRFRGTTKRDVSRRGSAEPRSELRHATVPQNREHSRHGAWQARVDPVPQNREERCVTPRLRAAGRRRCRTANIRDTGRGRRVSMRFRGTAERAVSRHGSAEPRSEMCHATAPRNREHAAIEWIAPDTRASGASRVVRSRRARGRRLAIAREPPQ